MKPSQKLQAVLDSSRRTQPAAEDAVWKRLQDELSAYRGKTIRAQLPEDLWRSEWKPKSQIFKDDTGALCGFVTEDQDSYDRSTTLIWTERDIKGCWSARDTRLPHEVVEALIKVHGKTPNKEAK